MRLADVTPGQLRDASGQSHPDWRRGLKALMVVLVIVFAGEFFGLGVYEGAARLGLDDNLLRLRVLHPCIVALYQMALLFAVTVYVGV